jgi:diacylglycerol kinase (ATP)
MTASDGAVGTDRPIRDATEDQPTGERPFPGDARIRVIWNAAAGAKAGVSTNQNTEERVRRLMAAAGLGTELVSTTTPAEAKASALEAARSGYDLVVAAGGDGTVETIAGELLGTTTALGVLPLGSVMNLARSLGIPRDPDEAAAALAIGRVRTIDVGDVRGRPFFEAASVGMNVAIFEAAAAFERQRWSAGLRNIWTAIRYRPARMAIELDDGRIRTRALMVSVSNGPFTGAGMNVAPHARLDDGKFDVVVFRRLSKARLVRHLLSIAFGRYVYAPEAEVRRSAAVRIDGARSLPVRADGRVIGTTPIELATRPAALRVVVPRD